MKNKKQILGLLWVFLILLTVNATKQSDMNPPVSLDISLSDKPYINQPVILTLIAGSTVTSEDAEMEIFLPEGIELVDGALKWNGKIAKGEKYPLDITVKVIKTGSYTIRGQLKDEKEGFDNNVYLYLQVTDNSAEFSRVPLGGSVRTIKSIGYMHSNDYYSVIYDGEGDAIVAAKLVIQNSKQDALKELNIEFPKQDIVIYNLVQEASGDKRYPYYDEYGRYNYGGTTFYPIEYDTEQTSDSMLLRLYLPKGIEPQGESVILILYKIPRDTSAEFLGIQKFDFKTIIDKNAALIQNVRVAVNVQEGLYMKGGSARVDYKPDYFGSVRTMSVDKGGMQSNELSSFSQRITSGGGFVRNAYNLDPYESFHVMGEFTDAQWKLYIFEILGAIAVIIAAIIILKAFLWKKIKAIFMNLKEAKPEQQAVAEMGHGRATIPSFIIIRSFIFGFASAVLIVISWTVIKFVGDWLSHEFYRYNDLIMPLFILTVIMVMFLSIFGFSIYAGIRYGLLEGVLTFIMTTMWLFVFLIAMIVMLGFFAGSITRVIY